MKEKNMTETHLKMKTLFDDILKNPKHLKLRA